MNFAIVQGTVVATQKVKELEGIALKVLIPCDDNKKTVGEAIIAVDTVGARPGDHVMWVGKREASLVFKDSPLVNMYPVDAAVTGIIDDLG